MGLNFIMKQTLKRVIEKSRLLLIIKYRLLFWFHLLDFYRRRDAHEVAVVNAGNGFRQSSDWARLVDHNRFGGSVSGGLLEMHNGIRVLPTAYNGYAHYRVIKAALGVHEPQEERLFRDILPYVSQGSFMLELGSYWAFYSIWFLKEVEGGRAVCVEPEISHLNYGKYHMRINGVKAEFINAFVGSMESSSTVSPDIRTVDGIVKQFSIDRLGVLHADIQGFEFDMLRGAERSFEQGIVDYCFVSTHSPQLHEDCRCKLVQLGMRIIADIPLEQSWNPDGLLVAQRRTLDFIDVESAGLRVS